MVKGGTSTFKDFVDMLFFGFPIYHFVDTKGFITIQKKPLILKKEMVLDFQGYVYPAFFGGWMNQ